MGRWMGWRGALTRLQFRLAVLAADRRGAWFIPLLLAVAVNVLAYFILPQPKRNKPEFAEDPENPTAEAGIPVPYLVGTKTISGLNCIWTGDKVHQTQSEDGQKFRKYRRSLHFGICQGPIDFISRIDIKDKEAWSGYWDTLTVFEIIREGLFGGDLKEGGINGDITFFPGDASQQITTAYATKLGLTPSTAPGYRGIASILFTERSTAAARGFYWGTSPYLPPVKVKAHRTPAVLDPDLARIYRPVAEFTGTVEVTWLQSTFEQTTNDQARMGFDFLDSDGAAIGTTTWATLTDTTAGSWTARSVSADAPAGAASIRVYMQMHRRTGTNNDGYIEDIAVTLNGAPLTMINPGAETGTTSGWTDTVGGLGVRTATPPTPNGTYYFYGGTSADTTAYQDVAARVDFDVNPAHIIYEALTSSTFGIGESTAAVDTSSFNAAAQALYDEGFGLSALITGQTDLKSFISEVLDHIEATLYLSPLTGLWTLTLIRNDYVVASLPTFTPDNAVVSKWSRKLWGETIGEVQVSFTNPENEKSEMVPAHDLANIEANGTVISDGRNYYMVHVKDVAARLAQRDIRSAGTPLASGEIEINREAWDLVPGAVVKLNSLEDGISSMVVRVMDVDYGRPGDPTIRAGIIEDVFAFTAADYIVPPITLDDPGTEEPAPAAYADILTLPYYMVRRDVDGAWAGAYAESFAAVLVAQAGSDGAEFELWQQVTDPVTGTDFDYVTTLALASRATLIGALAAEASSTITGVTGATTGPGLEVGGFLLIGSSTDAANELALITDLTAGVYTLRRGVLDTVPRDWSAGEQVWIIPPDLVFADDNAGQGSDSIT